MSRIVTFYSFKGGAGRTVCAANVAHLVAKERKASEQSPVLLLDMDLDSAGLTIVLDHFETYRRGECSSTRIATGDFQPHTTNNRPLFLQSLQDISLKAAPPRSVLFLGAEFPDTEFVLETTSASRTNLKNLFAVCDKEGISTILIDSASGRQEIAQVCQDLSQVIVYCCRLTKQFIEGTRWDIENFMNRKAGKAPKVIIYPVAVPSSKGDDIWKKHYDEAMTKLIIMANLVRREGAAEAIVIEPGLPEVESFKWEEEILLRKPRPANDERSALTSYSALAKAIARFLQ